MNAYADTSFLVSLYLTDSNSEKAAAYIRRAHFVLVLTSFQRFELSDVIRLSFFRRLITSARLQEALEDIQLDLQEGVFVPTPSDWPETLKEAERLSRSFTGILGNRGLDILHVASALTLRAMRFLTFDARQARLAKEAGLQVGP